MNLFIEVKPYGSRAKTIDSWLQFTKLNNFFKHYFADTSMHIVQCAV